MILDQSEIKNRIRIRKLKEHKCSNPLKTENWKGMGGGGLLHFPPVLEILLFIFYYKIFIQK